MGPRTRDLPACSVVPVPVHSSALRIEYYYIQEIPTGNTYTYLRTCHILCLQKMALTSKTSGGRSVGNVRSRTQATEFSFITHVTPSNIALCDYTYILGVIGSNLLWDIR
jgi:hypothetical protein